MVTYNLGSVGSVVLILVPETPTAISGTPLLGIADRERLFMEDYTGQSIGSTGIAEKFQPALIDLTQAEVYGILEAESAADDTLRLADFSVKSARSSKNSQSTIYHEMGIQKLNNLGRKVRFFKANG